MKRLVLFAGAVVFSGGCAHHPEMTRYPATYDGERPAADQVAFVQASDAIKRVPAQLRDSRRSARHYRGAGFALTRPPGKGETAGVRLLAVNQRSTIPGSAVEVLPGTHELELECFTKNATVTIETEMRFEADTVYEIYGTIDEMRRCHPRLVVLGWPR